MILRRAGAPSSGWANGSVHAQSPRGYRSPNWSAMPPTCEAAPQVRGSFTMTPSAHERVPQRSVTAGGILVQPERVPPAVLIPGSIGHNGARSIVEAT